MKKHQFVWSPWVFGMALGIGVFFVVGLWLAVAGRYEATRDVGVVVVIVSAMFWMWSVSKFLLVLGPRGLIVPFRPMIPWGAIESVAVEEIPGWVGQSRAVVLTMRLQPNGRQRKHTLAATVGLGHQPERMHRLLTEIQARLTDATGRANQPE